MPKLVLKNGTKLGVDHQQCWPSWLKTQTNFLEGGVVTPFHPFQTFILGSSFAPEWKLTQQKSWAPISMQAPSESHTNSLEDEYYSL